MKRKFTLRQGGNRFVPVLQPPLGLFIFLLFIISLPVMAQRPASTTVSGRITNEKGEPLAGASVKVKKSKGGTSTDSTGRFTLMARKGDELEISYVGFTQSQYIVSDQSRDINLVLKALPGSGKLDDVIVVGYGTQKKVNVLGSVSVVKAEDLVITKNENVVNMLTGKVPGLRIQQMSSEPGSFNTQYDIRGFGSNPAGNPSPPLIIIDGVPRGSGDLSRLDPNEIDNVSVLKDASAAIYGVKAANGVILVTTKRGGRTNGKFSITYSVNQSWQQFLDVPQGIDAAGYMELYNESLKTNFGTNATTTAPPAFSDSTINLYKTGQLKSTNWMKAITRPLAPETQHNLSMSGGSDKVNYFFDLGYLTQGSLFKTNSINYNRWNFRSNVNINFTKRLRGSANISGYTDTKNAPNQSVWVIFKYAENLLPTDPIYANNNPLYPHLEPDNDNPIVMANSNLIGQNITKTKNIQGQLSLEYDIPGITGLMAKGMYNYGYSVNDNTIVSKAYNLYTYDATTDTYPVTTAHSPSTVQRQYYTNTNTLMQLSLNYHHQFGAAHNVTALALYEESQSSEDNFQAQESFSLGIPYLFAGNAGDANYLQVGQDGNSLINLVTKSYIGRFDYDYKGRYLAEFSFREDGSSKFSPTARWGFFPAGLIGWRISNEPFMQDLISPSVLNNLKFRASYGKLGDDQFNNYQWVAGYNYPAPGAVINGSYVNGVASRGIPDYALSWVNSKTFNVGADFDLFNGLIGGSVEYFNRTRTGLPAFPNAQIPGSSGLSPLESNLNADVTKGIEVTLTHHQTIHRVTYNISGNIGFSRIKQGYVEETRAASAFDQYQGVHSNPSNPPGSQSLQYTGNQTGRYSNIWWGYQYGGQFTSYNQIYNYNVNTGGGNQAVLPGNYYYQDINHDGVIDSKDMVPLATRDLPMVNFGMTLSAAYRNFDAAVLLQGATDFHVQYAEQLAQPLMYQRSALSEFINRWHPADPNANLYDPNTVWIPGNYSATGTPIADGSKAVQNATYMRVKSLEIGYTLPKKVLNRIGIQNVRVYINSYNLATITGLKNSDPEHPGTVATGQDFNVSQAGYLYPMNRTFSCGASVSF